MRNKLSILLIAFMLLACDSNSVFDEYKPVNHHLWTSENKIEFTVSNKDTISEKNVFITIRNNKNYEFSSLFLITKIKFPSGFKVIDTLEYEMTDAEGNWLGSGFTDIKENKLFFKENVVFNELGNYTFEIQNATRGINDVEGKEPLKGITDVGLRIEKVK